MSANKYITPQRAGSLTAALLTSSPLLLTLLSGSAAALEEEEVARLEEVVVTAQKRLQSIQDVPVSVTTLSNDNLKAATSAGASVTALAGRLPSLNIENSSFGRIFPRPYIRGLGNVDFDMNASQPVSYIYDEVVFENPILKGFPTFDLERLEVLRGPQGTLFGRNTPAGTLKMESAKPTDELDGYIKLAYGTFAQTNIEGAVGGPIVEQVLSARVSLLYNTREDWIDNGFTGEKNFQGGYDDFAARVQLLWTPNQDFTALLNLHTHTLESRQSGFRANIIRRGSSSLVSGFDQDKIFLDGINKQDLEHHGVTLKLENDFGPVTLTSITGYETLDLQSRGDVDGGFGAVFAPPSGPGFIPFPSETQDGIPNLDQYSQELRLASNGWETLNWIVGLFYFNEDFTITSRSFDVLVPGSPLNGFAVQDAETDAWAVFAHIDWDVTADFVVSAGLRYSDDEKDFTTERYLSPLGFGASGPISVNPSDSVVTWDISGIYTLSDDVNLYTRIAQGFRAPSVQGRILFTSGQNGVSVGDTEEIISYEAGIKSELFDNRLRLNVAGYYYELKDQQLTATGGATNVNRLVNADTTEGYGFEVDLTFMPNENWLINGGISFNHTEIKDPDLKLVACGAGCTILDPFTQTPNPFASDGDGFDEIAHIDGNPLPNAPEWIANTSIRYGDIRLGKGEVYFMTDWVYMDDANIFLYESREFVSEAHVVGGIRAGYIFDDGYEIALYGRNITNEEYLVAGVDFNNLAGVVSEPRVWGVEFNANF